jgi:RsiW-degrading membrane proteinase PrsW (M82 family)
MSASVAAPASTDPVAPPPRWGVQASLIQPRQPAFWLFLVLLGIGGYLFLDEQSTMSQLPTALTMSWALVLIYAVPVALIVYRLDLFEREPKLMLAAALLWGGVIATSLAAQANGAWLSIMGKTLPLDVTANWGPAIVGPGVEETLKLMGVITLFLIVPDEFDGVMDGFIYGAMVGLGFTVVEDVSYFITASAAFGGGDATGPVVDTFLIRVVAGGMYSHVLFTAVTGMGFAYFVTQRKAGFSRRVLGFAACVAAGVSAHVVWNSPWMQSFLATTSGRPSTLQWIEYGLVKGMPFFVLLVVLVVLATRSEEKNFRSIVAGEPDPQVITEPEITSLGSLLSRRSARTAAGRLRGPMGSRLTGQLQAAQIDYAMIRSRLGTSIDPAMDAQRLKIRGIRSQLEALPLVAAPMGSSLPYAVTVPYGATGTAVAVASAAETLPEPVAAAEPVAAPQEVPPAWVPTHLVPPSGMAAWDAPDPSRPPMVNLPERLELMVESRAGAWALVRAINGWRGWVDGRRLVDRG